MNIENVDFLGMKAVKFSAGDYEALVIPEVGGNVVQLVNKAKNVNILRTPTTEDIETFKERPQVYGLPVLFPPNRIGNASYTKNGKTYTFPVTIPQFNNYHHGILKSQEFKVTKTEITENAVIVETTFVSNPENNAIYQNFDHEFTCVISNKLTANGLEQTVSFTNNSSSNMPLGFGFHTPLNVPFNENDAKNYRLKLSAGQKWELNDATLPTEKLLDLDDFESDLRKDGIIPLSKGYESHFTNKPLEIDGKSYNGAILTDTSKNISVFYEVDKNYKHWTLWNNNAAFNYSCPEPMTWMINAPNVSLSDEISGYQEIKPNETWSATTKLYVK